jgi:hypothetical protein
VQDLGAATMKLVETVSIFRMRYVIDTGNDDYAADTVVMEEAKEFSQHHVDECITSIRNITVDEYLELFDKDNDYLTEWEDEYKFSLITEIDE